MSDNKCPKCGGELEQDEIDGHTGGPRGCPACFWVEGFADDGAVIEPVTTAAAPVETERARVVEHRTLIDDMSIAAAAVAQLSPEERETSRAHARALVKAAELAMTAALTNVIPDGAVIHGIAALAAAQAMLEHVALGAGVTLPDVLSARNKGEKIGRRMASLGRVTAKTGAAPINQGRKT